jgi:16S rRNA (uracil1498-N3)-methyltransferase
VPRLYVREPIAGGATIALDQRQAHYLGTVMRKGVGDELLVFDGRSGEWLARIAEAGKKRMTLSVERLTREAETLPDLTLAFAPVKRAQTDWLVEKSTELGVARLQPVITARTVVERIKFERLEAIAIEGAEQCGRTVLPEILDSAPLDRFLKASGNYPLYFADEQGGEPAARALSPGPAAILIGPEGGFTDEERTIIRALKNAVPISLGPRILRAETAALAAVTAYMAIAGDWRAA